MQHFNPESQERRVVSTASTPSQDFWHPYENNSDFSLLHNCFGESVNVRRLVIRKTIRNTNEAWQEIDPLGRLIFAVIRQNRCKFYFIEKVSFLVRLSTNLRILRADFSTIHIYIPSARETFIDPSTTKRNSMGHIDVCFGSIVSCVTID